MENDRLVVELPDGRTIDVPCAWLPDAVEGDVYRIEKEKAEPQQIREKMNRLFCD